MHRTLKALLALAVLLLPLAACGGDDDGGGGGDAASVKEYCEFSLGLDEVEAFPTDEQFDELAELAPEEIDDDIDELVKRFKEANDNPEDVQSLFEDEDVNERLERVEAFEVEQCGRETGE